MNAFFKTFTQLTCSTAILLAAVMFVSGCSSLDKPATASFASVIIVNQTPAAIRQAVFAVFQDNGYNSIPQTDGSLAFQREATRGEQLSYAGIAGTQEGERVVIRVLVNIRPKSPNAYWLEAKAYAVCNPDQPVFENTTALFNFQSGPYQKLMDDVSNNLKIAAIKATETQ
jgi:hypothetical protein